MDTTSRRMPPSAFAFLGELLRRTDGHGHVPAEVRDAVTVLTAAADPDRADRLRPRSAEPPALVLRLATWALRQVDDDVVGAAWAVLHRTDRQDATATVAGARQPLPC